MALHADPKTAGKTFTAQCGHTIEKGASYVVVRDYWGYNYSRRSLCKPCWETKRTEQLVVVPA